MKKNLNLIIVGLVAVGLLAACSPADSPDGSNPARTINVNGTGRVTIVPDIATINIGVRTESEVVTDALDENSAKANMISDVLQDLGVAEEDIQTSNFNVFPSDQYNPMTGQVEGRTFVVENTVNVTVRDLTTLGDVLSAVVNAGANSIYGITFDVDNREDAIAEARKLAIEDAQAKAEAIAEEAGVELGELITINVSSGSTPIPYYDTRGSAYAAAEVPIAAGTLTITMQCNVSYEIN